VSVACATLPAVTEALPRSRGRADPPTLSATEVARLTGGRLLRPSDRPIRGGAVDSRLVAPGNLFVALPGERTDGHRFLADAAAAGAAGLVVSRMPDAGVLDGIGDVAVVLVRDGLAALQAVAAGWRAHFSPIVVGVTGSIAKTSTKEAAATVLAQRFTTLRSEGNQNNEIGLPLTLLRLGPEHEAAVLEMGMYVGGEIAELAAMARPQIGIVTAVLPVHLSRIGSLDAIEKAKGELVEALPPTGTAILNGDDPRVARMASRTAARVLTYGFELDNDVTADRVESAGAAGMRFVLRLPGDIRRTESTPALGRHGVHNALAAAAAGVAAGLSADEICAGLAVGWSAPHRDRLLRLGAFTILDDSYNASPTSVEAALDLLASLPARRRVAVLGEMLELGDEHEAGHRTVGAAAAGVADLLVVVGEGATALADAASMAGMPRDAVLRVPDADAALEVLRPRLREGDAALVKASRGIGLDRVVDALEAELGSNSTAEAAG
jgi:UDP-N-acetylmuramoyl-tripeptide--D-alanyl-D-alanine ligase